MGGEMETETIDRLFLELAQFTTATTAKEMRLESQLTAATERERVLVEALEFALPWLEDVVPKCGGAKGHEVQDKIITTLKKI
jgi:hypothetical protein